VTGDGSTSDGSGLSYGLSDFLVHTHSGSVINAPVNVSSNQASSGSITDSNGNTITNNGNGTFTDTLGVTALTVGGGASAGSPLTFAYPVTLQADHVTSATVTVYYKPYTVQTYFQCPGISEYGATSVDLIDHVTFPDSAASTYTFSYEATPGISGAVTGRLASIKLPTGGTISYAYSGGCNNSGINADGTVGSLARVTSDGSKSYTRASVNANATSTDVQDEEGKHTVYQFTINNGMFYETHRQVYDGNTSAANLLDRYTCYNGAVPNCDGAVIAMPINQTNVISSQNNGTQDQVQNTYSSGLLTQSTRSVPGGGVLLSQSIVYNTLGEPTSVLSSDPSSNPITRTTYGYDETTPTGTSGIPQHGAAPGTRGNQTSAHIQLVSPIIDSSVAFYDTGAAISSATPNGTIQYGYDPTQTFANQVTLPTPSSGVLLGTSASYDQQSGVQTSATGANSGQTTQVMQFDRLLRPVTVAAPDSGQATYSYALNQAGVSSKIDASRNSDSETFYDSYGRIRRSAVFNGSVWYLTDSCYDAAGLLHYKSVPYSSSSNSGSQVCSGETYTYDALGRLTYVAHVDGTSDSTTYSSRAVKVSSSQGVARITQSDLLGRTSAVCEISSNASLPGSGSPQACGMDIPGTGFLTNYSYDLANRKTTITQGGQTRIFQTDAAGRTIYTLEPERGATTYSYAYNSTGLAVTRKRPKANQTNPAVLTTTTTQYDSLGRMVSVAYDDGITLTKNYAYDMASGWNGVSLGASKGQLTYASTSPTWTGTQYGYDSLGRVVQSIQCLPNRCGNSTFNVNQLYSYDLSGNRTKDTHFLGANSGTQVDTNYTVDVAGEMTSISDTLTGATNFSGAILSNVQNGPTGPLSYQYGNGTLGTSTYDTSGRLSGKTVGCSNMPQFGCPNYFQNVYSMTSTIKGSQVMQLSDSALVRNLTMSYDEFGRLTSAVQAPSISYTYGYDRWGNRWSQNISLYEGQSVQLSFNTANNQVVGASYDAAGNLISNGHQSYSYDAEGNLLSVNGGASSVAIYDALNHRVQLSTSQYAFNPEGQRVSKWQAGSSSPSLVEAVTYWNGRPVSYFDGTGTSFTHYDALGTKRIETNYYNVYGYFGSNVSSSTSLPFGDGYGGGYGNGGTYGDEMHFAQLDRDDASNTEHAQFRQYDSAQGRWMSPDPDDRSYSFSNPQSLNRYTYVLNNPTRMTDPSGLDYTNCITYTYGVDGVTQGTQQECFTFYTGGNGSSSIPWYISEYGGPICGDVMGDSWPCPTTQGSSTPVAPVPDPSAPPCGIAVRCRPIQTDNLGKMGFQHCDATVTDPSGATHSVSGGPDGTKLNAWDTVPAPPESYTGTTEYTANSCTIANCVIGTTQVFNQDPQKPNYRPIIGPNSNDWLKGTFGACGVNLNMINTWGGII
jgi:RHS repeat-associated protein